MIKNWFIIKKFKCFSHKFERNVRCPICFKKFYQLHFNKSISISKIKTYVAVQMFFFRQGNYDESIHFGMLFHISCTRIIFDFKVRVGVPELELQNSKKSSFKTRKID